jgi:hydroxymethylpyrimidine kinase/phosphomethylpyrimidine kinase/thiamine-phosphate diphosphorylase
MSSCQKDMSDSTRPIVWSIAGSDSGAGAGVQADLRTFDAFDLHGCTAIAAITAQNSVGVERIEPVAADLLDAQLAALASDMPPSAIKTGLLGSPENVRCVAAWVDRLRRDRPVALVIDPVWRATTGADLASTALREVVLRELLPRATVITPNRAEAA